MKEVEIQYYKGRKKKIPNVRALEWSGNSPFLTVVIESPFKAQAIIHKIRWSEIREYRLIGHGGWDDANHLRSLV